MSQSILDPQAFVFRGAALAYGLTDAQLKRAASKTRELARVAPGVYVRRPDRHLFPEEWHRLVALAVGSSVASAEAPTSVLSFQSAAAVHGLDLLAADFERVHFTNFAKYGNIRSLRHTHPGPLEDDEIVTVDGVLATSLERTAVDVACQGRFPAALAVFDSALRHGADFDSMHAILERRRRRGIAVGRAALPLADPRSANAGESWSRAQMILAGLPAPVLQQEFDVDGRVFYTDFLLSGKVIGEFDGLKKYTKLMREGQESSDVVIEEKIREDLLRSLGFEVVRWTWSDLEYGRMIPRLLAVVRQAAHL